MISADSCCGLWGAMTLICLLTVVTAQGEEAAPFAVDEPALPPGPWEDRDLTRLAEWMSGYFTNEKQAEADTSCLDVRLRMVPIWPERRDGYWLYVEQATATHEREPYQQWVYLLRRAAPDRLETVIHALPDPRRFIGAWRSMRPLAAFSPDSLILGEGCTMALAKKGRGKFIGQTSNGTCRGTLRGAAYTTSEVVIERKKLLSWDRGFSADGAQVWGAVSGGTIFKKRAHF